MYIVLTWWCGAGYAGTRTGLDCCGGPPDTFGGVGYLCGYGWYCCGVAGCCCWWDGEEGGCGCGG